MKGGIFFGMVVALCATTHAKEWIIDSQQEWEAATGKRIGIDLVDGHAKPSPLAADPGRGFSFEISVLHQKDEAVKTELDRVTLKFEG